MRSGACSRRPIQTGVFAAVVEPDAIGGFVSVDVGAKHPSVFVGQRLSVTWHRTRSRTGLCIGDRTGRCNLRFCSHHQVRTLRAPAITNPEVDRFNVALIKQLRKFRLIPIGEKVDRTGVVPKRTQLPARLNKTSDRYAGVILQQQTTMLEQEITNVRKMVAIHQI